MSPTTIALIAALVGSPVAGALAARYLRPKQTQAEEIAELRADRAEDRAEAASDRARMDGLESTMRRVVDYVHVLRQHIADGKGPPPPPWPEGIDQ